VYGAHDGVKFSVALSSARVADAVAADEVLSGARDELAREGALAAGEGYPRVEVEVLRADETSQAVLAPSGSNAPVARATDVAIVARAWIATAPGAEHERDTGDMRAADLVAPELTARADALSHADALRAAARRIGARLARKVLGHPAPSNE
jgi:hypothetical protein